MLNFPSSFKLCRTIVFIIFYVESKVTYHIRVQGISAISSSESRPPPPSKSDDFESLCRSRTRIYTCMLVLHCMIFTSSSLHSFPPHSSIFHIHPPSNYPCLRTFKYPSLRSRSQNDLVDFDTDKVDLLINCLKFFDKTPLKG